MKGMLLICLLLAAGAPQQTPTRPQPESKTEFENEYVRVERLRIPPGNASDMHTHASPWLEVFLTDDDTLEHFPNGTSHRSRAKAGDVFWGEPVTHSVESLNRGPAEFIVIQFKGQPAPGPGAPPGEKWAGEQSSAPSAGVLLENGWARVTRTRLAPKDKGPMHSHPHYVGILLTEARLRITLADGSAREITGRRSDVSWHEPVTHSLENLAGTPFEAIDVNLKTVPTAPAPAPAPADRAMPRRVLVNGVELAYMEAGGGDPVVLVHGSLSDYRYSLPLMKLLARRFRVINYSRRCHWPNACPRGAPYSYQIHAGDLEALIRALQLGPAHVVGHSYGGMVALLLAQQHPEMVRSLALVEPGLLSMLPENDEGRKLQQEMAAAGARAREALAHELDEEAIRQLMDLVFRPATYAELPAPLRAMMLENAASLRASVAMGAPAPQFACDDAKQLRMPVLLLDGEQTAPEFRIVNEELARCVEGPQRVRIPRANHGLYFDASDAVAEVIVKFLGDLKAKKP